MAESLFEHIAIIGLGQMGASLAKALRAAGACVRITGHDADETQTNLLVSQEVLSASSSAAQAVQGADLVILCAPVGAYGAIMESIAPALKDDAVITDIGSVKSYATEAVQPHLRAGQFFVPAHPIAGSEKAGAAHAAVELFESQLFLVTLEGEEPREVDARILELWRRIGADAQYLPTNIHDQIYALMSHLPQALAYVSAQQLQALGAAGLDKASKRHLRISQSDPLMWRDVFCHNQQNMAEMIDFYLHILGHIKHELLAGAKQAEQETSEVAMQPQAVLPYLLAGCLVSTVTLYESKLEIPLHPFAAGGFTDFTYAASGDPDPVMQAISAHAADVALWLEQIEDALRELAKAIASGNENALLVQLTLMQQSGKYLCQ